MPDCVAVAIHTPRGRRAAHGRLQDRPDAARRRARRLPPARGARRGRRAGAAGRQHERRSQGRHRLRARRHRRLRGDLHERARTDRRRDVRVEPVPDADPASISRRSSTARWRSSAAASIENSQIAQRLGYLRIPPGSRSATARSATTRRRTSCASAPGRRASRRRRCRGSRSTTTATSSSSRDDVVVFSAREIPGNEKAIGRVMNHIARRGAEVVYEGIKHVHVSGHGSEEELKLMLSLVRPRYFVPIHGEYRQLARHARVATHGLPGDAGAAGGERRRHPVRRRGGADRGQGAGRAGS